MVWLGMGWFWSSPCGNFVPLCAFVIILCDILIQLNWVV
jgi:hypothetical protein